jgi:hypothetical protein
MGFEIARPALTREQVRLLMVSRNRSIVNMIASATRVRDRVPWETVHRDGGPSYRHAHGRTTA